MPIWPEATRMDREVGRMWNIYGVDNQFQSTLMYRARTILS